MLQSEVEGLEVGKHKLVTSEISSEECRERENQREKPEEQKRELKIKRRFRDLKSTPNGGKDLRREKLLLVPLCYDDWVLPRLNAKAEDGFRALTIFLCLFD